ncbi:hypothetical protein KBY65_13330 [Cyanobium sp. Alchichica 3B3-8F6]|uniref:hypothetical protein n=1 Tax=Cyanobium sp. Alchichica 3B3-8F6 TaxID=2823696 RepID=UPI0020CDB850|nr:hypothetical protein [Cyanobium sp. Alchichica 3B3-8F6]MCP9883437.1 hypothetical protein [Cyanobium sp. Alchichica 3B3-8F6]
MTDETAPNELLPMPAGAIELPVDTFADTLRALAVAALRQALVERRLALPLGPEAAAEDDGRLLSLNRFGLQLATAGISADQIAIDPAHWAEVATAPQLLLAALVDEENDVVCFPGVLTGQEFVAAAEGATTEGAQLLLPTDAFAGGLDRLLTLVQLLEPAALPRLAFRSGTTTLQRQVVVVSDWLTGQLDGALAQLFGAQWQPVTQGAFFSVGIAAPDANALALVAIPLGLDGQQLVCGQAADHCIERFVLQMIATGSSASSPDGLVLRLTAAMAGDLLPDGLTLLASQGSHEQRQSAVADTGIELVFHGGQTLIDVRLSYPGSTDLVLPPLQLPG